MDWKYFLGGLGLFLVAYFLYRGIGGLILADKSRMNHFETNRYVKMWIFIILFVVMGMSAIARSFGMLI